MENDRGRRRAELSEYVAAMSGNPAYNLLMQEVCVGRGWCGGVVNGHPSHIDDFIPLSGPVSADQFVDWLFAADGYDPSLEPVDRVQEHRRELRNLFIQHMQSDVVDASQLKWGP